MSETITPLSSKRTPMAAARVIWRKAMSPSRSRSSTLARVPASTATIAPSCSAMSTTDRLRARVLCYAPRREIRSAYSNNPPAAAQAQRAANRLCISNTPGNCSTAARCIALVSHRIFSVEGLATGVLYLARPHLLDFPNDLLGHRDVIEFFRHLVALGVSPGEKFERRSCSRRIVGLLMNKDESCRGHRPRLGTGLVCQDHAVAGDRVPVRVGGGSLERRTGRRDRLAFLVDHLGVNELVLQGVGILDVAN